jgi:hypothetical protein
MNNNEAGPSIAEPSPADAAAHGDEPSTTIDHDGTSSTGNPPSQLQKTALLLSLDDLIRTLDLVVWVEIALVYFMEYVYFTMDLPQGISFAQKIAPKTYFAVGLVKYRSMLIILVRSNSFLRFILRSLVQLVYLMPKSPAFPEPETQPYVGGILGTNVLCMILHAYFARPEAGEATRGYLHGGLLLDFVGQKGPSSKLHLILLDTLIVLLQLTALAATIRRKTLAKALKRSRSPQPDPSETTEDSVNERPTDQDHDAEERGEQRRPLLESQPLRPDLSGGGNIFPDPASNREWDLLDRHASGQSIIADLLIADTVRQQHDAYQAYRTASTGSSVGDRVRLNLGYNLNLPFRG